MNEERFIEIMCEEEQDSTELDAPGCNIMKGLKIITKYLPNAGIDGAGLDVVYSAKIEDLVNAGIIEDDVKRLRDLNWMVGEWSRLSCFV